MNKQKQHQEYARKVREILDLPSTTWNSKIDFIADYIQQLVYDAMCKDCSIVGHIKHYPNKIEYYPGNTSNGYCYKNDEAFRTGRGVCYIREAAFENSDNNIVSIESNNGHYYSNTSEGIYTRQDIIDEVKQRLSECGINDPINVVVERIAEYVYQQLEWSGVDVFLEDSDLDEEYYGTLHDIMTHESYLVVNEYLKEQSKTNPS